MNLHQILLLVVLTSEACQSQKLHTQYITFNTSTLIILEGQERQILK